MGLKTKKWGQHSEMYFVPSKNSGGGWNRGQDCFGGNKDIASFSDKDIATFVTKSSMGQK